MQEDDVACASNKEQSMRCTLRGCTHKLPQFLPYWTYVMYEGSQSAFELVVLINLQLLYTASKVAKAIGVAVELIAEQYESSLNHIEGH